MLKKKKSTGFYGRIINQFTEPTVKVLSFPRKEIRKATWSPNKSSMSLVNISRIPKNQAHWQHIEDLIAEKKCLKVLLWKFSGIRLSKNFWLPYKPNTRCQIKTVFLRERSLLQRDMAFWKPSIYFFVFSCISSPRFVTYLIAHCIFHFWRQFTPIALVGYF